MKKGLLTRIIILAIVAVMVLGIVVGAALSGALGV